MINKNIEFSVAERYGWESFIMELIFRDILTYSNSSTEKYQIVGGSCHSRR